MSRVIDPFSFILVFKSRDRTELAVSTSNLPIAVSQSNYVFLQFSFPRIYGFIFADLKLKHDKGVG